VDTTGNWAQRNTPSTGSVAGRASMAWVPRQGVNSVGQPGRWQRRNQGKHRGGVSGQASYGRWIWWMWRHWRAPGSGRDQRRLHSQLLFDFARLATLAATPCCWPVQRRPPERQAGRIFPLQRQATHDGPGVASASRWLWPPPSARKPTPPPAACASAAGCRMRRGPVQRKNRGAPLATVQSSGPSHSPECFEAYAP